LLLLLRLPLRRAPRTNKQPELAQRYIDFQFALAGGFVGASAKLED
jgi:hypothetical protein